MSAVARHEPEVVYLEELLRHVTVDHACGAAGESVAQIGQQAQREAMAGALAVPAGPDGRPALAIHVDGTDTLLANLPVFERFHEAHHPEGVSEDDPAHRRMIAIAKGGTDA
jgi:hypothetical protein